jgi:hypothetical protein
LLLVEQVAVLTLVVVKAAEVEALVDFVPQLPQQAVVVHWNHL